MEEYGLGVVPPAVELGELLNRLDAEHATLPCPRCQKPCGLDIYELGVRWSCGHVRALPRLPHQVPNAKRKRGTA